MAMWVAEQHAKQPQGLSFTLSVFAIACLALVLIPAAALGLSYVAGGEVTSLILFAYLAALLTNGGVLAAVGVVIVAAVAVPRLFVGQRQHAI